MNSIKHVLQAWQTPHLPRRGHIGRRPKVHSGFQRFYHGKKFSERMLHQVKELMMQAREANQKMRILVTGQLLIACTYKILPFSKRMKLCCALVCILRSLFLEAAVPSQREQLFRVKSAWVRVLFLSLQHIGLSLISSWPCKTLQ